MKACLFAQVDLEKVLKIPRSAIHAEILNRHVVARKDAIAAINLTRRVIAAQVRARARAQLQAQEQAQEQAQVRAQEQAQD